MQADTVTRETLRAPNRTTAHGCSTTGPRVATEAGRLRGVPMTAVEAAQLIAHGDLAPMPPWREVGIEAGRQLDEAVTEALNLGDAA